MGKGHYIIGLLIGSLLIVWLQGVFQDISNFPCHIDIDRWTKATTAVSQGNYYAAVQLDRLPLYLFMGAEGIKRGMLSIDALQLISRVSWALCMAFMYTAMARKYGFFAAIFGLFPMLWAHSYAGMTLEVTAQIFFNMLVALHFWLGYKLATSNRFFSWIALGIIASILPLAKEQGFLFPPCTLLFLLMQAPIRKQGWSSLLKRALAFGVGALPLHLWLLNWVTVMRQVGSKYKELESDINTLQNASSFDSMTQQSLYWGSLDQTYQKPASYFDLLYNAWPRLTHEIGTHLIIGILMCCLVIGGQMLIRRATDKRYLGWIFIHVLPGIPLFLMLLIEPYHLSFFEIPAAALMAWAFHHTFYNRQKKISFQPWHKIPIAGLLIYGFVYAMLVGQPFTMSIPGQIGACIAGRMIPVMHYLHRGVDKEATIYVTDTVIRFNKTLPPRFKAITTPKQLPDDLCSQPIAVISSPWTAGWSVFRRNLVPPKWRMLRDVRSINNETWYVYEPICTQ